MKRIILLWVLFPFFTFGQNRYIDNDPYWSLDITKSENFDILDLKKWYNEIDIFESYGKIHNNTDASSFGIVDVLREDNEYIEPKLTI